MVGGWPGGSQGKVQRLQAESVSLAGSAWGMGKANRRKLAEITGIDYLPSSGDEGNSDS